MTTNNEQFLLDMGNRIKQKREDLNLSQDELAKKTGYTSRSSINKIEKGLVDLTQSKIQIIADALETTPTYLMGWDDNDEPPITMDDFTYAMYQQSGELTEEQKRAILHMVEVMKQSRGF